MIWYFSIHIKHDSEDSVIGWQYAEVRNRMTFICMFPLFLEHSLSYFGIFKNNYQMIRNFGLPERNIIYQNAKKSSPFSSIEYTE